MSLLGLRNKVLRSFGARTLYMPSSHVHISIDISSSIVMHLGEPYKGLFGFKHLEIFCLEHLEFFKCYLPSGVQKCSRVWKLKMLKGDLAFEMLDF